MSDLDFLGKRKFPRGKRNLITDVAGVKVGHKTLSQGDVQTGVTAILPHEGNIFQEKVRAACHVINGFGKTTGLIQVKELGTLESPIIMTNTLSVGTALTALVKYSLAQNEDIGLTTGTVNCLVAECNDGKLNDIRGLHIKEEDVFQALENSSSDFEEGGIGAGRGMVSFGLKGGIGSASSLLTFDEKIYTLGCLVLVNFGSLENLTIKGRKVGEEIQQKSEADQGSIIIILATDLPLSSRQLKRMCKRSTVALGRLGSYLGNGSGDMVLAFSTANKVKHYKENFVNKIENLHEDAMDIIFQASCELVEEAILKALYKAESTLGREGRLIKSLREYL